MFTVSCYSFHPVVHRFVRLWKYVQIVSDILTFLLSMICCQCVVGEPLSPASSVDLKKSMQIFEAQAIKRKQDALDKAKSSGEPMRAQHLVIDFAPGREDTPEIQARCHQYWELAKNKTDHERKHPSPKPERHLINLSSSPPHLDTGTDRNNLPAIHSMKKTKKKGCVKAPFGSGEMNHYFT
ncbi:hypothetical protein B5X24_HaOG213210 [Helicoverpa armigera]|uniref:Uncharacterized protein n=1 Tax=Helicoverpa armigera TaxID=29058 RepID=A0A2W1B5I8_HELAM|nr:hypothetical protein B5X24_HaOG213210 [Helicoverpa armigera]